jgi:hypothetical protein
MTSTYECVEAYDTEHGECPANYTTEKRIPLSDTNQFVSAAVQNGQYSVEFVSALIL